MKITQELEALAIELQSSDATEVAVGHLKKAGLSEEVAREEVMQMEMEKEAAEQLVMAGIDVERAVSMVKAANLKVKELGSIKIAQEIKPEVELLTKAASYINELEAKVSELEGSMEVQAATYAASAELVLPEALTKVASSGALTREDLMELSTINPELLTKVASAMEQPWGMGKAAGMARPKTDPFLEFCLG
jgi:hypothetical protein